MSLEFEKTTFKKRKNNGEMKESLNTDSSQQPSIDSSQQNEEQEEQEKITKSPNNIINVNRIHEVTLSRNNHNKNNLFHIEEIAQPSQINNYFRLTQISEAILLVLPKKPITNNNFVSINLLIFFEKQENVKTFTSISQIKKNKRLLSKKVNFTLQKNTENTNVFEINKSKFIYPKSAVFKFNKRSDKKGKSINISNYSLYYAISTYYTSSNSTMLLSQLRYEEVKRENYLLENEGKQSQAKVLTEEINPHPDTIMLNIEFVWKN